MTFTGATLVPVEGRTPTFFGFAQGAALFPRTHSIRFNFEKMVWEQDLRFTSTTQAPRAIPLADGSAFVAGGARRQSPLQGSTNTWKVSPDGDVTNAPGLLTGRVLHEMGLWSKNCVLVAGGMRDSSKITGSCEWVDLERGVTTQAPSLNNPRAAFKLAVVPMRDGRTRAFAVSGVRPDGQNTNSIEVLEDSACETRSEPVATSSMRLVGSAQNDGSAIQLTADESNRSGAAFIRDRVLVRNGFELSFSFRLTKGNDGSNTDGGDPGADGLAVVFLPGGPSALSTAAGGLGYDGIGHGMAVEFDAFRDTSALDPNGSHVAVQIGNGRTLSARHEAPFMRAITAEGGPSLRADGTLYFGRISLSGNHLSVSISESTTFGDPVIVISDFDISRALGLDERGSCFIGFTASTGASFQQHTLVSVNLQNCEPLFVNVDEQTPEIENVAFSVTPNPASATALVKFTAPLPMNSTMSISDVHGRLVWRQDIAAGATSTSIGSLAELPSGTYVVLLPVGSGVLTQTLCIVR